jgi:hypothetical protein
MHTNEPREDPLIDMGYEIRDVDYPKLRKAVFYYFGFAIFCGLCGLVVYLNRFVIFGIAAPKEGATMNRTLPKDPFPVLQTNISSKTDIADMRAEETKRLNATEYADDTHTVVHIPVDKAMQILVDRGLPKTASAPASPSATGQPAPAPAAGGANLTTPVNTGTVTLPPGTNSVSGAGVTSTPTTPAPAPPKGGQ